MMVCQCNGVSDRTVRRVIRAGASTVGQVARSCGAGASCGGCEIAIRGLLRSEAQERELDKVAPLDSLPGVRQRPEAPRFGFSFFSRRA
ncbi:MAG: (2Fe-2S)-binding protein [Myxococcota bacterium]|nr:(2Fe-2S)-binding protein [Myxococcota bacterium]